ncbi:MAG: hypothetical protein M0P69_11945 [Bacteroidales bacterium]|nr:hypothetical protein [Bacteroidales bacterium]
MKKLYIAIRNESKYDPEMCETGGGYWFREVYSYVGVDQWRVSYGTSSIFRFCQYCGSFINEDGDCSCFGAEGGYIIVSDAEVAEAVDMAYADPDNYKVTLGTYVE